MWEGWGVAPAYPRQWGLLLAGLMQGQPTVFDRQVDGFPLTEDTLADLTETCVPVASAMGCALMRPVKVGTSWKVSTLKPTNFAARWAFGDLVSAQVWDWVPDTRPRAGHRDVLVIVEDWDNLTGVVTTALFEGVHHQHGTIELGKRVASTEPGDQLDEGHLLFDHQYHQQIVTDDRTIRYLIPFVWAFEDGQPIPVYRGNEQLVKGLIELWTAEQEDAELARNRIAMSSDMVNRADVYSDAGGRLAHAGFHAKDRLLITPPGMSAQSADGGGVEVISMPDSLIQRERIERRENATLEAIGINPQSIGRSVSGRSDSAAAKRADQQMTQNTIGGPARRWQHALNAISGEVGRLADVTAPVVDVREGLRQSFGERVETASAATAAEAMSTRTKIAYIHPEWDDTQVDDEVARMAAEGIILTPIE